LSLCAVAAQNSVFDLIWCAAVGPPVAYKFILQAACIYFVRECTVITHKLSRNVPFGAAQRAFLMFSGVGMPLAKSKPMLIRG
jgi:hypothetical protein